jgi:hypothetical protein
VNANAVRALATIAIVASSATAALGAPAEDGARCPADMQMFEGVCLSNRMIAYLKCLEKIGGGKLHVTKDEETSKPSSVTVELQGEGGTVLAKGSGKVKIDTRNDQKSIRKLDETLSPDAVTGCIQLAGIERRPAPRAADKTPSREREVLLIPRKKYVAPNQADLQRRCDGRDWNACVHLAPLLHDRPKSCLLYTGACNADVPSGCTGVAWCNEYDYPEVGFTATHPGNDVWARTKVLPYYLKACAADDAAACWKLSGVASQLLNPDAAVSELRDETYYAKAMTLWQRACDKGDLDACSELAAHNRNERKACDISTALCKADRIASCHPAGTCYDEGKYVPQDDKRATDLYEKGCQGGDYGSCDALSKLHAARPARETKR